jgi:hypothetical protein
MAQTECLKTEELTIRLAQDVNGSQRVAAIATEPLTEHEEWESLPEAQVVAFVGGKKFIRNGNSQLVREFFVTERSAADENPGDHHRRWGFRRA